LYSPSNSSTHIPLVAAAEPDRIGSWPAFLRVSRKRAPFPDRYRAAVHDLGVIPLGAALGGLVADLFGLPAVFAATAVVLAATAVVTLPSLTNARLDVAG
jgi:hypothetical protein